MNVENFRADLERTPFHITTVFKDNDDVFWAWEKLFNDVCDSHAPYRDIKIRSISSPWINNEIKQKMNRRFKTFKKAIETKDCEIWTNYKKLRNEITSEIRAAKTAYFQKKLDEVTTSKAYWNLLAKATKPKDRKAIGQLKRDDGSLAVDDKEKATMMNSFFSTIGEKLAKNFKVPPLPSVEDIPSAYLSETQLTTSGVSKKITALNPAKATGPDDISPKLLKLAGTEIHR
jgi:hypothetical protein